MTVPPPVEPQKRSEAPMQQLAPVLTAQLTPAASTRGIHPHKYWPIT